MPVRRIRCGIDDVGIPENAYEALLHLRFANRLRFVWMDYLCIRQNDSAEKSQQVRMLHMIYAQAHVISWLGSGHGVDLQALSYYLPLLACVWIETVRRDENRHLSVSELSSLVDKRLQDHFLSQATDSCHRYLSTMITSFVTTEYFERIWTVQEIILGKTNTLQMGDALFSVAVLAAALRTVKVMNYDHGQLFEEVQICYLRPALHKHWNFYTSQRINSYDAEIVDSLQTRLCSDKRDSIYAIVSLFRNAKAYLVDYALSIPEVFADLTVHCLSNGQGTGVFNKHRRAMCPLQTCWDALNISVRHDLPSVPTGRLQD